MVDAEAAAARQLATAATLTRTALIEPVYPIFLYHHDTLVIC